MERIKASPSPAGRRDRYVGVDEYVISVGGDPATLPDKAVEVELRGPAADVAAVRTWIAARASMAEAVTTDDPEQPGGAMCRMRVVPPEE